jgi:hypothetical protein
MCESPHLFAFFDRRVFNFTAGGPTVPGRLGRSDKMTALSALNPSWMAPPQLRANPVRAGFMERTVDWPWSSARWSPGEWAFGLPSAGRLD